jgi:hypothetical protein
MKPSVHAAVVTGRPPQQEQGAMRAWLSARVRLASTQRVSSSPVMRQSAVTARRIDAMARHGLPQLDVPAASAGGGGAAAFEVDGRAPAEGGGGAVAPRGSGA